MSEEDRQGIRELANKVSHSREIKRNNEKSVPMHELKKGKYKIAYEKLCSELVLLQEKLENEYSKHLKKLYSQVEDEAIREVAGLYIRFCGVGPEDDVGWEQIVNEATAAGKKYKLEVVNEMLRFVVDDIGGAHQI